MSTVVRWEAALSIPCILAGIPEVRKSLPCHCEEQQFGYWSTARVNALLPLSALVRELPQMETGAIDDLRAKTLCYLYIPTLEPRFPSRCVKPVCKLVVLILSCFYLLIVYLG